MVFGGAIGSRMQEVGGVPYGAFIVPGLIMLSLFTQSIFNASFGIYFPKFTGTIYEILSAPVSSLEIVLAYVGAAATKSAVLGLIILATASFFVPLQILHPFWMMAFLILISVTFSLFGFIIGVWADGFEQLQMIPMLIVTPDLPGRRLLLHRHAAGGLAHGDPVQSDRLSDLWIPLGLLWSGRCLHRRQPGGDPGLFRPLPCHCDVDVQDRISAQELNRHETGQIASE